MPIRSWYENEDILQQFRRWLTQTGDEIESLGPAATEDEWDEASDEWNSEREDRFEEGDDDWNEEARVAAESFSKDEREDESNRDATDQDEARDTDGDDSADDDSDANDLTDVPLSAGDAFVASLLAGAIPESPYRTTDGSLAERASDERFAGARVLAEPPESVELPEPTDRVRPISLPIRPEQPPSEKPDRAAIARARREEARARDDERARLLEEQLAAAPSLLSVVESLTALRQELKLQTKASRGLDETVATALRGLETAGRQMQSVQAQEAQAAERAAKPLVESLTALDEALERGARAFQTLNRQSDRETVKHLAERLKVRFLQQSNWQRWWTRRWQDSVLDCCAEAAAAAPGDPIDDVAAGYELIRTRLQKMLADQGIRRIDCVGRKVDPQLMTVVELVEQPGAVPETVVAELRPGYLWRDRVLRYAEVRAVRRS